MDLTTLAAAAAVALGLMITDVTISSDKILVEAAVPQSYIQAGVTAEIVDAIYLSEIESVLDTPSVVPAPPIRGAREKSLASSLANALHLDEVAQSVQRLMGYDPPHVRASVIVEQNATKFIVVGTRRQSRSFEITLEQRPDETIVQLIKRGALETMYQLAPYSALVHALQTAESPSDFDKIVKAINLEQEKLPNVPISPLRSQYENLLGIIALLNGDVDGAANKFNAAALSDTRNVVALLNLGFVACQRDAYAEGERIVRRILEPTPLTREPVLLSTAYMTWACTLMGQKDFKRADVVLAQATLIHPRASSIYDLWGDLKEEIGEAAEAKRLRHKARENSAYFENYAEVAMLYFELAWRDKQSLRRNKYGNPNIAHPLMTMH